VPAPATSRRFDAHLTAIAAASSSIVVATCCCASGRPSLRTSSDGIARREAAGLTRLEAYHGFVGAATELRLAIAFRAMVAPGLNVAVGRSADGRTVTNRAERNIISAVRAQDAAPVSAPG
jgi:hypothetical protein